MKLLSTLCSGIAGAENGVARIYTFGTSQRANYYAGFDGPTHVSSGQDLALDANGSAIVYVNQLVDVTVFDSLGNQVRVFSDGDAAPSVEVISNAFTGTDRTTGALAAGNPTTLQAILDLWLTSSGTIDWKVLLNGVPTNLKNALAGTAGLFFNVKDPAYGAKGDGATDDTTAVQNCVTAAGAVKGIVFFPAGTYRITSTLNIPIGTSLWGVGSSGSAINVDHATAVGLTYAPGIASGSAYQEIRNLSVAAQQSNSGHVLEISGAAGVTVAAYNCIFGNVNNTGDIISVGSATNDLMLDGCVVSAFGAANKALTADQTNAKVRLRSSRFGVGLGAYNGTAILARNASIQGCTFDMSGASSGTNTCVNFDGTAGVGPKCTIVGSEFIPPSGGTTTAISVTNANEATTSIAESGNIFRNGWTTIYNGFTAQSNIPSMLAASRQSMGKNITDNTASVNVLADQFGYTALTRTTGANQTMTTSVGAGGAEFTLIIFNNSGGALGTQTFGAGFASGTTAIAALANGKLAIQQFRAVYVNGAAAWVPVAANIAGV